MRTSILLSALFASAFAAPAYPELNLNAALPGAVDDLSEYFTMLVRKIQQGKSMSSAPSCDLSKAVQPIATPTALPTPTEGLVLKHIALGRGTQNYTCDLSNTTAVPVQVGALATLFNASCVASMYPDFLAMLPKITLNFNLSGNTLAPANLAISGHHYFTTTTTPFFNMDTDSMQLGEAPCAKNSSVPAPASATKGLNGELAVPWLRLLTKDGATGNLQEVYRLNTAGGSAPASCTGQAAAFEVQYSAEYWFYESA